MVAFTKLNGFVEHLAEGVHNLGSGQLVVALSNTAGDITTLNGSTSACVLANLSAFTYTNLSSRNVTTSSSSQTSGTYSLVTTDLVLTSSGGSTGPLRYVFLYNDTPTSPADPMIGYYDYGSSITLADTETLTIDFGSSTLTLA